MNLLQRESGLMEIVQLVGKDAISPADRVTLEAARMVREDFLQQNAFVEVDWYSSYDRQEKMLGLILEYEDLCRAAAEQGAEVEKLFSIPAREKIGRAKSVPEEEYPAVYKALAAEMKQQIDAVTAEGGKEA